MIAGAAARAAAHNPIQGVVRINDPAIANTAANRRFTFAIRGGFDAGTRFYDALKLFKRLVNLGDAKSLACHPASTTHRQMSPEEQRNAGVRPETIRLSIGIEHIDDIVADLDQALRGAV